jgi:nucleoside phosphorylase
MRTLTHQDYKVGWVCALYMELSAAMAMLDEHHGILRQDPDDDNSYVLGRIGQHNVVIASLPDGETGTNAAAHVATHMRRSYKEIRFGLMVGIGGGVPNLETGRDIRLGDIVVSRPTKQHGGVLQYDYGTCSTTTPDSFRRKGFLNAPPQVLRTATTTLRAYHHSKEGNQIPDYLSLTKNPNLSPKFTYPQSAQDKLFKAGYTHVPGITCVDCDCSELVIRPTRASDPVVHYGTIGSGNQVMKNGIRRDEEAARHGLLCFETEAAGLMNTFPCIVIRGISDYADSHKNGQWKDYAAATAAAYAKELLRFIAPEVVTNTATIQHPINSPTPSTDSATARGSTVGATHESQTLSNTPVTPQQNPSSDSQNRNTSSGLNSWFSVFPGRFLNWDEVALGRLVLNLRKPEQDFCPYTIPVTPEEISIFPFQEIKQILKHRGEYQFSKIFAKLISGLSPGNRSIEPVVRRSIQYTLLNSGSFFVRLVNNQETQQWLERVYRQSHVYLAVSIHSIVDFAAIGNGTNDSVETLLASRQLSPGDRIIGVQYRRLRFKSFKSAGNQVPTIENGRWQKYDLDNTDRGNADDSLEVSLDDHFDLDDLDDEFKFEVYTSNESGEKYVLLVCIQLCWTLIVRLTTKAMRTRVDFVGHGLLSGVVDGTCTSLNYFVLVVMY